MKKQWLLCYVGCSGSGKSTAARELKQLLPNVVELNRDEWRFKLFTDGVQDWSKYKFSKEKEDAVTAKLEELFYQAVANLSPIVVSNTNLNKKDQDYWKKKAEEVGYDFNIKYFPETLTTLMKRDKKRGALAVGQDVLFAQWQKWLEISGARKYEPDENKPKAIILDIDGTVALTNGRSHYDYSEAVLTDRPRLDVIDLVETYAVTQGAQIICVSGRSDICKNPTKEWLDNYRVDYSQLFMRKGGDDRCDTIIKEEIFWEDIAPYYNVIAAFDDRKRCIRKWIDLGIPLVLDVSKTYVEF
jgi:predicted kinase